ncbi:MAG TPA: hypothetical protein EYN41_03635 [Flavobacteriales bacterium]|nr:hypothetical protein [Flavobacteriales bacterium]
MNAPATYSDEIDFRKVLKELLIHRKRIVRGVVLCTIAAIIISLLIPRSYQSTGFFKFRSVHIPAYKSYTSVFEDVNMLSDFISKYHEDTTWQVNPSIFEDSFEPVYGFGKNRKNLMKDNKVLGITITSVASSPEEAQKRVETLGSYLETCLVNREIWKYYGGMYSRLEADIINAKASMIEHEISVEVLNKKVDLINNSLLHYDPITNYERQVVKLDETTEKYLPPHQQLIATRVSLNNESVYMEQLERKMSIDDLLLRYVKGIEGYLENKSEFLIEKDLLNSFIAKLNFFFEENREDENVRAARFRIEAKHQSFILLKDEQYKFISGPLLPAKPEKPMKLLIVLVVFFASLVGFVTYSVFLSWWTRTD